jgi:hypothetical protein
LGLADVIYEFYIELYKKQAKVLKNETIENETNYICYLLALPLQLHFFKCKLHIPTIQTIKAHSVREMGVKSHHS